MEKKLRYLSIPSSEITPAEFYFNRREFLKRMGIVTASALLASCAPRINPATNGVTNDTTENPAIEPSNTPPNAALKDELGDPANTFEQITNYNNYYEFSTDKQAVARLAQSFKPLPWTIEVTGLVNKPKVFGMEDLLKFEQVERIYRLRCVEAWSMVIPWMGFELRHLLDEVEPLSSAKYIQFITVYRPEEMPGLSSPFYPWPYDEGLRLDEAYHRLTLLSTGLYGQSLLNQNGAPIRLVVPWKYGFKSIKSIVKIELTEEMPPTFWSTIAPDEYGFFANVNPQVSHPRWSQATERRIGELSRRETLLFNGYGEEVSSLYTGMGMNIYY